jgi:hypothetical protein
MEAAQIPGTSPTYRFNLHTDRSHLETQIGLDVEHFFPAILFPNSESGMGLRQAQHHFEEHIFPAKLFQNLESEVPRHDYAESLTRGLYGDREISPHLRISDLEASKVDMSDLDASFICSGAFRLMLTTRPDRHLYLDKDGYLHIFWDFKEEVGSSLNIYKDHFFWNKNGRLNEYFYNYITNTKENHSVYRRAASYVQNPILSKYFVAEAFTKINRRNYGIRGRITDSRPKTNYCRNDLRDYAPPSVKLPVFRPQNRSSVAIDGSLETSQFS